MCTGKKLIKTRLSTVVPSVCSLIVARRVQSIDWTALCQPIWRSTDGIKVNRLLREVIKRLWEKDLIRAGADDQVGNSKLSNEKKEILCARARGGRDFYRGDAPWIFIRDNLTRTRAANMLRRATSRRDHWRQIGTAVVKIVAINPSVSGESIIADFYAIRRLDR